jgi:N-acetylglutamate synthase-like GNAT family acetyltransferase
LLSSRLDPLELINSFRNQTASIIEDETGIQAFCASWETDVKNWSEIGTLWVNPEQRGKGYGKKVFSSLMSSTPPSKKYFLITHNPSVVHLSQMYGFKEGDKDSWLEVPFTASCEPCDRVDNCQKLNCKMRADVEECRMFYFKSENNNIQ